MNSLALQVAPEVKAALDSNLPVVALESTLITHGLPYPRSMETALAMEAAVRAEGAVPATIAVIKGQVRVGLSKTEIDALAQTPHTRKCSRRDLPIAVALGETGSTTVAGTMIVAHMAGIRVFATGGIGGVHRGHPEDVSADLIELGRTPVAVISSGAKSILDLPRTMEVLETQGVPVIGYGTDTLPSFFSRSTDIPVDVRIESPEQAAAIIAAAGRLGIQHGALIVVPVPEADEIPSADAEAAIAQAAHDADERGISGRELTPFLLSRVSELTGERSQRANLSLLVNNARVAAQIAVALAPHYDF
ncbi:MAG TPA: pseudouridine-5'-phosphate glycosidase [Candidatus Limnocylindrales bacterium]|nr:pseudouridine-5'-phosphate glycosidase [Candidatus Limnocylindrales bacterium]